MGAGRRYGDRCRRAVRGEICLSEAIEVVAYSGPADAFWAQNEREALSTLYDFRVVWHAQRHEFRVLEDGKTRGAVRCDIAASLATITALIVVPSARRNGIGRALLERVEDTANYYNCHKVTLNVPAKSAARAFFEACGYHLEAILPQHTFKLDVAVMRKFLL